MLSSRGQPCDDKQAMPGAAIKDLARNATLTKLLEDVPLPGETRTVCDPSWLRLVRN
jgi:hypothetical protein